MKKIGILMAAVLLVAVIPATSSKAAYSLSDNCEHLSISVPTGATSMTDTYGEVYKYDAAGNVASKTTASGYLINYTYDAAGNEVAEIEYTYDGKPWGGTAYQYDAKGRVIAEKDGAGTILYSYTYDDANMQVVKSNPSWSMDSYTYTYNKEGQLVSYKVGDSEQYNYTYSKDGNVTSIDCTNPYGGWSKIAYTYDANGNVASETQTDSYGTNNYYVYTNTYDAAGRLVSINDGHGTVYTFTY